MRSYGFDNLSRFAAIDLLLLSKALIHPGVCVHLGSTPVRDIAAMQFSNGIVEAIGNTPLIKLERVSAATGCTILGKAEFMNPGPVGQGPRRACSSSRTP